MLPPAIDLYLVAIVTVVGTKVVTIALVVARVRTRVSITIGGGVVVALGSSGGI